MQSELMLAQADAKLNTKPCAKVAEASPRLNDITS